MVSRILPYMDIIGLSGNSSNLQKVLIFIADPLFLIGPIIQFISLTLPFLKVRYHEPVISNALMSEYLY